MTQKQGETKKGYKMLRKIGSGGTSEVWKVRREGKDFALKIFRKLKDNSEQKLNMENE